MKANATYMKKLVLLLSCSLFSVYSCKEVYKADFIVPETGYLVVEGFINSGNSPTTITLTRSVKLKDAAFVKPEINARVFVESDSKDRFALWPIGGGSYTAEKLTLSKAKKYRINITTQNGKNYTSEFVGVKVTPPIDSISWKRESQGLRLYVNAHDDAGNTKFYRWRYDETWEIRSSYISNLKYETIKENIQAVYKFPDMSFDYTTFRCWQYFTQRSILIGSTEMLTKDIVYVPVALVPENSIKLSVLYSIELKQYALSAPAYRFYLQMKKNTEQLGTIFDPQPSDVAGNITCTTDPSEVVVGYVDITQEQALRIFISPGQVGGWGYRENCERRIIENMSDSIKIKGAGLQPITPEEVNAGGIITFSAALPTCIDCTLRGSNIKPPYWPN